MIAIGDVELHHESFGTGDPFVLLHGYTGSCMDWHDVAPALAARRCVITCDHRGHGDSTKTGDGASYTFDQLTADFAGLVDALALDQFDLLGHSMGGSVALRYVLAHPERVRSLVLMDTAPYGGEGFPPDQMDAAIALARTQGMAALAAIIPAVAESPGRRKFEQMDPEAFAALGLELSSQRSVLDRLPEIACPTTVLVGEGDMPTLRTAADVMAEHIPGAQLVVIADALHSPHHENREAWLAAIEGHFARVATPGTG